jgi:hypothetical protein
MRVAIIEAGRRGRVGGGGFQAGERKADPTAKIFSGILTKTLTLTILLSTLQGACVATRMPVV